jgi:hypothetical protein
LTQIRHLFRPIGAGITPTGVFEEVVREIIHHQAEDVSRPHGRRRTEVDEMDAPTPEWVASG